MGLFGKIKNIFYDEEYIEAPATKVAPSKDIKSIENIVPKIEPILPKKEEVSIRKEELKNENTFSERELFKTDKTFNFPVFDDDEEIEEVKPSPPPRIAPNVFETQKRMTMKKDILMPEPPKKEEKKFRPSPVVSPIYGILDKNYKKEDIPQRSSLERTDKDLNYDYVRRKAYGTLEEEIEHDIKSTSIEMVESVNDIEEEIDSLSRKNAEIEDLLNEIEAKSNITIEDIEEEYKDRIEFEEEKLETAKEEFEMPNTNDYKDELEETISDNTLEHDLFNLIDSMYEDKEE